MKFNNVNCCEQNDIIYYSWDDNVFYLELGKTYREIKHCPWCGIVLDISLMES